MKASQDDVRPGTFFGPDDQQHVVGEEIGAGAAGRVFSCVELGTGEKKAVKVINLHKLQLLGDIEEHMSKLNREVQILRSLRHERVVNLHDVYRTPNWTFLVMDLIAGGELFTQIVNSKGLNELESRYVFRQLLEGIGYMHGKNVIHRDLKPENILIAQSRPIGHAPGQFHDVKIADFGLSKVISETTSFAKSLVGTPQYYAPEVLDVKCNGSYDQAADFWGLGVVLFVMLSGRYPFDGKQMPMEHQIRTAAFSFTSKKWANISEAAQSLIRGLLKVKPRERLRLEQCVYHQWVVEEDGSQSTIMPSAPKKENTLRERDTSSKATAAGKGGKDQRGRFSVNQQEDGDTSKTSASHQDDDSDLTPLPSAPSRRSAASDVSCELLSGNAARLSTIVSKSCASEGSEVLHSISDTLPKFRDDEAALQLWEISRLWFKVLSRSRFGRYFSTVAFFIFCFYISSKFFQGGQVEKGDDAHYTRDFQDLSRASPLSRPPSGHGDTLSRSNMDRSFNIPPVSTLDRSQHQLQRHGQHGDRAAPCPDDHAEGAHVEGCRYEKAGQHQGMADSDMGGSEQQDSGQDSSQGSFHSFGDGGNNQETIFRLSELLKLQVSIAGSLEMARLAFRHTDPELAEATRLVSRQAGELFQHAANVVSRYGQVASQVSKVVMPDLHLAIQESEPSLAASLLDMVKDWVIEMKTEGDATQQRYGSLSASVIALAKRAQETKTGADRRLFKALQAVEAEPTLASPEPDSFQEFAVATHTPPASIAAGAISVQQPSSLNGWTRELFDQLSELTAKRSSNSWNKAGVPMTISADSGGSDGSSDDSVWRKDLVDLLFLAPGVDTSALPKLDPMSFAEQPAPAADEADDEEDEVNDDAVKVEDDEVDGEAAASGTHPSNDAGQAVVSYNPVQTEYVKSEAESATHSSAALLRVLQELKRVDSILQGCSAFWANMDGTVQRLAQMKEHTSSLVNFASKSNRLRERFEQRLGEYVAFWDALDQLCRQYCVDHTQAVSRMNDFLRELTETADLIDTMNVAKAGVRLARKEKTLRLRYALDAPQPRQ